MYSPGSLAATRWICSWADSRSGADAIHTIPLSGNFLKISKPSHMRKSRIHGAITRRVRGCVNPDVRLDPVRVKTYSPVLKVGYQTKTLQWATPRRPELLTPAPPIIFLAPPPGAPLLPLARHRPARAVPAA